MPGRNTQINVYAKELLDTSFLVAFSYYVVNSHFFHTGRLEKPSYDNIVGMLIVLNVLSVIIRCTVVKVWGFRPLPWRQYVGYVQCTAAMGITAWMYSMNLMNEDVYRMVTQSGYCILTFGLVSAKIRNA